jgi:cytochrome c553
MLQTRDGRELKLSEPTALCGSCHGPTYRDWEMGIHGRTSGYWNRKPVLGEERKVCVNCHDPHAPKFPGRKPAPGPHPLRPAKRVENPKEL